MSVVDRILPTDTPSQLQTSTGTIDVSGTTPAAGDGLIAQDASAAQWQALPDDVLASSGGPVTIDSATPAEGDVLTATGANDAVFVPRFQVARLYRVATLSLVTGWQTVPMDTAEVDPWSLFDAASGGIKFAVTGFYIVFMRLKLDSKITTLKGGLQRTGSATWTLVTGAEFTLASGNEATHGGAIVYAEANDVLVARAYLSSNAGADESPSETYLHIIGPL